MVAKPSFFTAEKIAATETIQDPITLSPDATKVLYHVKPAYKSGEHETCAIWIASTNGTDGSSSRQLTSGLFNDCQAQFHPDGKRVVFLSDRHKAGGPKQLYSINLDGGEPAPLFGVENRKDILDFKVSPDGRYIAFTSLNELSEEDRKKEESKDDPIVFGDKRNFARLRIYSFSSGIVRTLNVSAQRHVFFCTWKSDSKELLFATARQPEEEFRYEEVSMEKIVIATGDFESEVIAKLPISPTLQSPVLWLPNGDILLVLSRGIMDFIDSAVLLVLEDGNFIPLGDYGGSDDVVRAIDLKDENYFAVEVAHGVHSRIDIFKGREKIKTIFDTEDHEVSMQFWPWDVKRSSAHEETFVLVAVLSSATRQDPPQIWSAFVGENGTQLSKISSHYQWLDGAPELHTEIFRWRSQDGSELDGIITLPPQEFVEASEPLPTVLFIHGGPYWRDSLDYHFGVLAFENWRFLLASNGYLVISPNYRGGIGHGSNFAKAARGGMGNLDWSDCESMLDEAIRRGLSDPNRLGIGGWSQGGFLTAWGVSKTKNRFKAAVMGAGVSDWGQLAAESDVPDFEAGLAGSAPWSPGDRADLKCSPIGFVQNVETAVLILHGQEDRRVPVSQGVSYFRGLRRQSKYPERAQLIVYPREPHVFQERKHVEDVLKRVIAHFQEWL